MPTTMKAFTNAYIESVRQALEENLGKMEPYQAPAAEKLWHPFIELPSHHVPAEKLQSPIELKKNDGECLLLERSLNSIRVSIRIKQADSLERLLCHDYCRFLMRRAESFKILRRSPIQGYDISFLVTNKNLEEFKKDVIVDFIVKFMEEIDKFINELKLSFNAHNSAFAEDYLRPLVA